MNLFRKKILPTEEQKPDWTQREAHTPQDYFNRGMAFYARKQYSQAEEDLRQAVSARPGFVDAWYSLGLVLKAQGRAEDARSAFQQALTLLPQVQEENKDRAGMLRRLISAHLNVL